MGSVEQVEKANAKEAAKNRAADVIAEEAKLNEGRTGVGLRFNVGYTRGRNPQKIQWEAFDTDKGDTVPTTTDEFFKIIGGAPEEKQLVDYLVRGYNDYAYEQASDPVAEFVNSKWPIDVQKQFRVALRNFANAMNQSLEDAAKIMVPGINKAHGIED